MNLVLGQPIRVSMLYAGQYTVAVEFATGAEYNAARVRLKETGVSSKRGVIKTNYPAYIRFFDTCASAIDGVEVDDGAGNLVDLMTVPDWKAQVPDDIKIESVLAITTRDDLSEDDEQD